MIARRHLLGASLATAFQTTLILPAGAAVGHVGVAPEAQTRAGRVRGILSDGIACFKGIRYGADTAGAGRFQPPRPPKPWRGVRDAVAFSPMCPQVITPRATINASWTYDTEMSEDCLALNLWTPALRDHRKRPVMVWFHGGGFANLSGSRNVFDGTRLARKGDVVVVTLNHRLNAFGYLYLGQLAPGFADSGNAGLLDLVAALRWVRDNIAEFGGDPGNVTIFGQSGGGAKVSCVMAMPEAQGLFHRAVVQSGSYYLQAIDPDAGTRRARSLLAALDMQPADAAKLSDLPMDRLVAGLTKAAAADKPDFSPVADGRGLPAGPWSPAGPAASARVPLMVGTVATEETLLIGNPDPATFTLDEAGLRQRLARWFTPDAAEKAVVGFRALRPNSTPSDLFFAISTDKLMRQGAWKQAERKAAQHAAPVWLYELDWATPVEGGKWRSPHSLDLAMVFDNVAMSAAMVGTGPEPQKVADQMSATWLAFARLGNPNNPSIPTWPVFDPNRRLTMVFDVQSRMVADHRGGERLLLDGLSAA
jgi:para-nitrobenzyl esterase